MTTALHRHRRIATETAWVFAGQGLAAVAAVVGLRLITEMVSPMIYGAVALSLGVVALAHGLAVGPLMQAALRFFPDLTREGREAQLRRATLLALRKPALVALVVLTALGAGWSYWQPQDAWLATLSIALFAAEAARTVEVTFLNAARRQRAMALFVVADAWLRPIAAVAVVWVWGPHGAAIIGGYLIGATLVLAVYWTAARPWRAGSQRAPGVPAAPAGLPQRLSAFAWPLTALPLIGWVSGQADRYLLGAMVSVSAAGVYAALYGLSSKPFLMLAGAAELALRQPFYARVSAADRAGAASVLGIWLGSVLGAALIIALLILLFHAQIAGLLLAAEYRTHSGLMGWIAIGYVLLAAAQVLERVCYAHHDTRGVLGVQTVGAVLSIAIAAPLLWRWGIDGAAWAVPAYFGAQLLITLARAKHVWQRAKQRGPELTTPRPGVVSATRE